VEVLDQLPGHPGQVGRGLEQREQDVEPGQRLGQPGPPGHPDPVHRGAGGRAGGDHAAGAGQLLDRGRAQGPVQVQVQLGLGQMAQLGGRHPAGVAVGVAVGLAGPVDLGRDVSHTRLLTCLRV
jgi:hypothetical protein